VDLRSADDILLARRGEATLTAYVIGVPWARELILDLDEREVVTAGHGPVIAGTITRPAARDDSPLGRLQRAIHATLPQPAVGMRVAILERSRGALIKSSAVRACRISTSASRPPRTSQRRSRDTGSGIGSAARARRGANDRC
jgi:hypothetical protein